MDGQFDLSSVVSSFHQNPLEFFEFFEKIMLQSLRLCVLLMIESLSGVDPTPIIVSFQDRQFFTFHVITWLNIDLGQKRFTYISVKDPSKRQ